MSEILQTISRNDKKLNGDPGVIAVLHTHSRALDYHPHIHAVMPAAIVDQCKRLWRTKPGKYLFNHKALAKVFRAKMLTRLAQEKLSLPKGMPDTWVVDCKRVGGQGAYLPGALSVSWRHPGKGHSVLPGRQGHLPVSEQ